MGLSVQRSPRPNQTSANRLANLTLLLFQRALGWV